MSNVEDGKGNTLTPTEVAQLYYDLGPARTFADLALRLNLPEKKQHALSKIVRGWESKGFIKHHVFPEDPRYLPRRSDLEDVLRKRFGLRTAIVVDVSLLERPKGEAADDWSRYDDRLHSCLGVWAGRLLSSNLRPTDVIGTGGGRGPQFAVLECFVNPETRYSGKIISLTGKISARMWNERTRTDIPQRVDADDVAESLHEALNKGPGLEQLRCSIVDRKRPHVKTLTVAIIGIGALGGGHRLVQFEGVPALKKVAEHLKVIRELCARIEAKLGSASGNFSHPIGDICNHYFLVKKVCQAAAKNDVNQLRDAIQALNKQFVNVNESELEEICARGIVLAVAGGPHKWAAAKQVLENNAAKPRITHLVTDHELAEFALR